MNPLRSRIPSENQTCLPQDIDSCWIHEYSTDPLRRLVFASLPAFLWILGSLPVMSVATAQNVASSSSSVESGTESDAPTQSQSNPKRSGYLIQIDPSLTETQIDEIIAKIASIQTSESEIPKSETQPRTTVILHFGQTSKSLANKIPDSSQLALSRSDATTFEDQLQLARYLLDSQQRQFRFVAWMDRNISNHACLPLLAVESIIASDRASLIGFGDASGSATGLDATAKVTYLEVAKQRGLFPSAVVEALIDPSRTLSRVTDVEGDLSLLGGDSLEDKRVEGNILQEEVLSSSGVPLQLSAKQLRELNITSRTENRTSGIAEFLDLAQLETLENQTLDFTPVGRLLEINGPISSSRLRRWQSNLAATRNQKSVNTWLLEIDSHGGAITESARFAYWLTSPGDSMENVSAIVSGEAKADATLIALACKPLFLSSDAKLGGDGLATPQASGLDQETLSIIAAIAAETQRSPGLIQGLVDPSAEVYRFTHTKTGAVAYSAIGEFRGDDANRDDQGEDNPWIRGERIDLSNGINARQALEFGLADTIAETPELAARKLGMQQLPSAVTDQALVRTIERLGSSNAFAILLLFIGFAALSAEFSSPGLGIPGFIALLCFALYFWIKLLSGTAEWLELVAFLLGISCVAIEFFIIPGFGVFGIGGFLLTGFALILMSQTFVIPRNAYQLNALSSGVWVMLSGLAGLVVGLYVMRSVAAKLPVVRALTMESPDLLALDQSEKLNDYQHLLGMIGVTTTPLHPSGKARFGNETVQVISEGVAIDTNEQVVAVQVRANQILVKTFDPNASPLEDTETFENLSLEDI